MHNYDSLSPCTISRSLNKAQYSAVSAHAQYLTFSAHVDHLSVAAYAERSRNEILGLLLRIAYSTRQRVKPVRFQSSWFTTTTKQFYLHGADFMRIQSSLSSHKISHS
jgi:hypothetical protein